MIAVRDQGDAREACQGHGSVGRRREDESIADRGGRGPAAGLGGLTSNFLAAMDDVGRVLPVHLPPGQVADCT